MTLEARGVSGAEPRGAPGWRVQKTSLRRVAVVTALAAFGVSVCLNAYLVRAAHDYYRDTAGVRLDPAGLKKYATERVAPQAGSPLLVFFGDSRALMWSEPASPTGYRIVNRGIGQQTTAQMLLRVESDVARNHPAVVVIEGGVNDLKAIADFPARRGEIVADCEANLEHIVGRCRRGGATVVLATVFGIGDVSILRRPFWSREVALAVHEVNAFLARLAGDKVILLDADPVLADERGYIRQAYQLDHLHLSSAGYAALNQRLVSLLATLPK
jgi:lysophospholipase L1-like esterase